MDTITSFEEALGAGLMWATILAIGFALSLIMLAIDTIAAIREQGGKPTASRVIRALRRQFSSRDEDVAESVRPRTAIGRAGQRDDGR